MIKLLAGLSLVTIGKCGNVMLTPSGEDSGIEIEEKYTQIYPFFSEYLALDEADALDSTYALLCGFSETCLSKLLEKGLTPKIANLA